MVQPEMNASAMRDLVQVVLRTADLTGHPLTELEAGVIVKTLSRNYNDTQIQNALRKCRVFRVKLTSDIVLRQMNDSRIRY